MSEPTPETGTAEVARPGSLAGRAWLRTATPRLRTRPRPPSCGQPRVRRGMQPDGPRMTGADCQDVHAFQLIAPVQPSCVDDVGSPHVRRVVFSRHTAKFVPLRHDDATISFSNRGLRVRGGLDGVAQDLARTRNRYRVVCRDARPLLAQAVDHPDRSRFPNVIRIFFEGEAEDGDPLVLQRANELFRELDDFGCLSFVRLLHGRKEARIVSSFAAECDQRPDVFRETAPSVTRPRLQEQRPDSRVESDGRCDSFHIDPGDLLRDVGHGVDVADLGRQERVARILDHLGRFGRRLDGRWKLRSIKAADKSFQVARRSFVDRTDHEFVRTERVVDRRALLQEFRVRAQTQFDPGESRRVDFDAERVETPIGEGDGRTESNITQAYERYGQAVLAQGHISGGSSSAAVLDPRSTTDAFLWSLVPHANRRPPMRTGGQRPEAPRILNYRPIYGSCECSYPSYGTAR